jgi:hypothetical protein
MSEPQTSGEHLDLLHAHPLIEEILEGHRDHARGDERGWTSYRGHAYRVFNMARVLVVGVQVIPYLVVHVIPWWLAVVVLPGLGRAGQGWRVDDVADLVCEVFG